ncbi:hypothetical protein EI94DRAFT_1802923 [Lactarius quietus]|nr:hypothetical protein EI94DRAFT_1802923 [Lactarius quietus]
MGSRASSHQDFWSSYTGRSGAWAWTPGIELHAVKESGATGPRGACGGGHTGWGQAVAVGILEVRANFVATLATMAPACSSARRLLGGRHTFTPELRMRDGVPVPRFLPVGVGCYHELDFGDVHAYTHPATQLTSTDAHQPTFPGLSSRLLTGSFQMPARRTGKTLRNPHGGMVWHYGDPVDGQDLWVVHVKIYFVNDPVIVRKGVNPIKAFR